MHWKKHQVTQQKWSEGVPIYRSSSDQTFREPVVTPATIRRMSATHHLGGMSYHKEVSCIEIDRWLPEENTR